MWTISNKTTLIGVPQGSVLGPMFFTIYTNNIPRGADSDVKQFVYKTSLFSVIDDVYALDMMFMPCFYCWLWTSKRYLGSYGQWFFLYLGNYMLNKCFRLSKKCLLMCCSSRVWFFYLFVIQSRYAVVWNARFHHQDHLDFVKHLINI